ncbi:type I-E CRISPR-associated protein Cas7/Cse4/CasC [Streptomyces cacaoi]|uniref:type I-E CRISPR-associated protein Cas7/Cse4/CasC n=1 Tax=Streptomyces cacaoi TaxID=1898 RepID=UPI00374A853E
MSRTARFIDIHVVQPVPYSNLNRDDTNSVKSVLFGDTLRTRVSSQSWKRAIREHFQDALGDKALRTRRIGERVAEALHREHGWGEDEAARAGAHVAAGSSIKYEIAKGADKKAIPNKVLTNALLYLPESAVAELAELCVEHRAAIKGDFDGKKLDSALPKKTIDEIFRRKNGVIQLFGRMLAEVDNAEVDGAVQVAHAFTTHTTEIELDYFSAVDDVTEAKNDATGSGHMGTNEYSAGTFYRFATVDLDELTKNLERDSADQAAARSLVRQFLLSFISSLPQAKKNSTAPHTVPHLAHIAVRSDRPLSFAAAFEEPVKSPTDGGFTQKSSAGLDSYANTVNTLMGSDNLLCAAYAGVDVDKIEHLGERHTGFASLVDAVVEAAMPAAEAPQ